MGKTIDIYIHHDIQGESVSSNATGGELTAGTNPQQAEKKTEKTATSGGTAKSIGVYLGKQALQYATSNYGDLTGDYIGQAWVTEGIEFAGMIGVAASSPMGAVAVGVSLTKKAIDNSIAIKKANQETAQLRERVGGVLSSGGRR